MKEVRLRTQYPILSSINQNFGSHAHDLQWPSCAAATIFGSMFIVLFQT